MTEASPPCDTAKGLLSRTECFSNFSTAIVRKHRVNLSKGINVLETSGRSKRRKGAGGDGGWERRVDTVMHAVLLLLLLTRQGWGGSPVRQGARGGGGRRGGRGEEDAAKGKEENVNTSSFDHANNVHSFRTTFSTLDAIFFLKPVSSFVCMCVCVPACVCAHLDSIVVAFSSI